MLYNELHATLKAFRLNARRKKRRRIEMKIIPTTFLALIVVSAILAQTGNDVADYGLQAGTELTKAIADKNFKGTMGKLATKVGPYLGMVGPVVGILFSVTGRTQDSDELQFMRNMLATIENRFDQVDQKLDELARKIDWNTAQIQFFLIEKKILPMKIELDKFFNASNKEEVASFQKTFTNMYECVYENSGQLLYQLIVSRGSIFSNNLLQEVMRASDSDRRAIQVFMLGLTKLLLVGSQIELTYCKLKHPSSLDRLKTKWTRQMDQLRLAMEAADRKVKNKYPEVSLKNGKMILTHSQGNSSTNQKAAEDVYKKLTKKFYWRNWFVAVYDDIKGHQNHQVGYCNGYHVFRHAGFNLLVASNLKKTAALDKYTAEKIINSATIVRNVWWFSSDLNAKEIYKSVNAFRTCKYTAFGVIRSNAHVHIKAEYSRLVTNTRGNYLIFVFH